MGESPNSGDSLPFKEPIDTPELNLGVEPSEAEDVDDDAESAIVILLASVFLF